MKTARETDPLAPYLIGCYLINLVVCLNYWEYADTPGILSNLFKASILITYPLIYLAPIAVSLVLLRKLRNLFLGDVGVAVASIGLSAVLTITLYVDVRLFDLYGFHINAFVINLLMTPGGVESMGGGQQTYISAATTVITIITLHVALYLAVYKFHYHLSPSRRILYSMFAIFLLLTVSERMVYGFSELKQYAPVLKVSSMVPLYNRVTIRDLAKKFGVESVLKSRIQIEETAQTLNYPLKPLTVNTPAIRPNIIWLVSESMRWDMLSPEIMPNTWEQSHQGWRFTEHFSGGNGTRQGLFSLFYGIYGSYWETFLAAHKAPVLMEILAEQDYQLQMYTSADFTYPEFDQTLFANLPASALHQLENDLTPWQRDKLNTSHITEFIRSRDTARPFMVFMFYESTHARYDFPEETALRTPYLPDLNYATMTRKSLAPRISELKNRYINASHFIDSELAGIYQLLTEQGLWENTIVMLTGDHGEEFMENGFWGHNAGFSEQQIRTPMVLWLPGESPRVIEARTSHMDIVPTLLPLLGVSTPSSEYSIGQDIQTLTTNSRPYIVVSDWAGLAYLDDDCKFTLPFNSSLNLSNQLFDRADKPSTDIVAFLTRNKSHLDEILTDARRFTLDPNKK